MLACVRERAKTPRVARALLEDLVVRGVDHRASAAVCVGRIEGVEVGARPGVRAASIPSSGAGTTRPGTWWGTCRRSCRLSAGHDAGDLEARGEGG